MATRRLTAARLVAVAVLYFVAMLLAQILTGSCNGDSEELADLEGDAVRDELLRLSRQLIDQELQLRELESIWPDIPLASEWAMR